MHSPTIRHLALRILTLLALPLACYSPTDAVTGSNADEAGESEDSGTSASSGADTSASSGGPTTAETGIETDAADDTTAGTTPVCGNGMVEGDEVCDDGENDGGYDGCTADCTGLGPHCGDGIEQGEESCDDGDQTNGNGCNNDCVVSGTVLWTQYHGPNDLFWAVAVTPDDAIVTVGTREVDDDTDAALVEKWSPEGASVWLQTYTGPSGPHTSARGVAADDDGGYYVSGSYGATLVNVAYLRKYDVNGNIEYTAANEDGANHASVALGAAVSPDGYAVVSGYEVSSSDMLQHAWLQRVNQAGDELWSRDFLDSATSASADAIAVGPSGEIVVTGTMVGDDAGDLWLRKYSQEGGSLWTKTYDDGERERGSSVDIDDSGNIAVAGSGGAGGTSAETFVRRYDGEGTLQWSEEVALGYSSGVTAFDSESNVVLAVRGSNDNGSHELSIIKKYDVTGVSLWEQEWIDLQGLPGPDDFVYTDARAVAVDSLDRIIVAGSELGPDLTMTAWVRKVAP